MKQISVIIGLIITSVLLCSCISMQEIKPPQSGSDKDKSIRFEHMQDQWSYLNNCWIKGRKVRPETLERLYNIQENQAKSELKEFVFLQRNHCGFRRFILSLYLNQFRYYVD